MINVTYDSIFWKYRFQAIDRWKLWRQFLSWSINEYTAVYTTVDYEIYWATKSHFQKKYANFVITN